MIEKNNDDEIMNNKIKTPMKLEAYYPHEDKYVSISYALAVRERNDGEYRENPCVWSKIAWEEGYELRLFPKKRSIDGRCAHFAFYPDQNKKIIEYAYKSGVSGKYLSSLLRREAVIDMLWSQICIPGEEDLGTKDIVYPVDHIMTRLGISRIEKLSNRNKTSPDYIFHHTGKFFSNHGFQQTNLFIKEHGIKPSFDTTSDCWILDITKYEEKVVSSWPNFRTSFLQEWIRNRNSRDKRYQRNRKMEKTTKFNNKTLFSLYGKYVTVEESMANPEWFFLDSITGGDPSVQ